MRASAPAPGNPVGRQCRHGAEIGDDASVTDQDSPTDEAARVTLVLADDHAVVRRGLRMLLDAEPGLRGGGRGGDDGRCRALCPRAPAGGARARSQHARVPEPGGHSGAAGDRPADPDRRPHDAERPGVRPRGTAKRRRRLRAQGVGRPGALDAVRMAAEAGPTSTPSWARRWRRRRPSRRATRRPDRARGRGPQPDRPGAHERRGRRAAIPQRSHGRVPPGSHPAEDPPHKPCRARPLCDRARLRRCRPQLRRPTSAPSRRAGRGAWTTPRAASSS